MAWLVNELAANVENVRKPFEKMRTLVFASP